MGKINIKKEFETIYKQTYNKTLKYIICKCQNIEDVNDLIQDTYIELYRTIHKKYNKIQNKEAYIIGIANNLIKKYYGKQNSNKIILFPLSEEEHDKFIDLKIDLEKDIVTKDNVDKIWQYLKNKDINIAKIFYLYYSMDMKIIDIAKELDTSESNIKNYIYRTLKELKKNFGKEGNKSEGMF